MAESRELMSLKSGFSVLVEWCWSRGERYDRGRRSCGIERKRRLLKSVGDSSLGEHAVVTGERRPGEQSALDEKHLRI